MFKSFFKIAMITFASVSLLNAADFKVDKNATKLKWHAEKVTGEHEGYVDVKSGNLGYNNGMITNGKFAINMKSITCIDIEDEGYNSKLVNHLKSDDFFSVEKHPEATFNILKVESEGNTQNITGNLTIKGITQKITFPAVVTEEGNKITAKATIKIDRSKFDIKFRSKSFFDLEALGDKMIYDEFTMTLNLVAKK
jgi:polyisoprenoid-binding protein YceI